MGNVAGPDTATVVAVTALGTVSLGWLVFVLTQTAKRLFPGVEGRSAEAIVLGIAAIAAGLALWGLGANWFDDQTYLAWIVGTFVAAQIARGEYATNFKAGVQGIPPGDSEAVVIRDAGGDARVVSQ